MHHGRETKMPPLTCEITIALQVMTRVDALVPSSLKGTSVREIKISLVLRRQNISSPSESRRTDNFGSWVFERSMR
jgi:hypothetical protein